MAAALRNARSVNESKVTLAAALSTLAQLCFFHNINFFLRVRAPAPATGNFCWYSPRSCSPQTLCHYFRHYTIGQVHCCFGSTLILYDRRVCEPVRGDFENNGNASRSICYMLRALVPSIERETRSHESLLGCLLHLANILSMLSGEFVAGVDRKFMAGGWIPGRILFTFEYYYSRHLLD